MKLSLIQLEQSGLRDLLEFKCSRNFGKKVADLRLEKKDKISEISYPEDCVNLGEENAVMTWLSESDTDKLLEKLSDAGASYKLIYTIKLALGLFL